MQIIQCFIKLLLLTFILDNLLPLFNTQLQFICNKLQNTSKCSPSLSLSYHKYHSIVSITVLG